MTVTMHCPKSKCSGAIDLVVCLYTCPKGTVAKCAEYNRKYDEILVTDIPEKYIEKYGEPTKLVPLARRKRRKRVKKET
jgi:cytochrome oxidase Cu insertion factor (SCO1/SenC/PrrC family)